MKRLWPIGLVLAVGLSATPASASSSWHIVPAPQSAGGSRATSTVVTGPSEAWLAGYRQAGKGPYQALIERFSPKGWTIASSAPVASGDTTFLNGLAATGPSDVWTVGSDTNSSFTTTQGLIEHWNGQSWTRSTGAAGEPAGSTLVAVSADNGSDAWAVGYSRDPSTFWTSPLIERWNGSRWSVVSGASSYPVGPYNRLETVVALSASDIWALGVTGRHPGPVFEHFNGATWSIVPQPASGYDTYLDAITARASNDIWAVGGTNVTDTLIEHWDGVAWHIVPSPNVTGPGSVSNVLTGVSSLGAGDVWAVGSSLHSGATYSTLAEHWDGSSWTITPAPSPQPSAALNAVSGLPGGRLFAVGWAGSSGGPLILEH
jgi:hypothetical protein